MTYGREVQVKVLDERYIGDRRDRLGLRDGGAGLCVDDNFTLVDRSVLRRCVLEGHAE